MTKILIIGAGKVGTATNISLGNVADFHDPYKGIINSNFNDYDYAMICVDSVQKGPNDYHDLESVLNELNDSNYAGVVVIRSTVSPKKIQEWDNKFKFEYILFPEFLKQLSVDTLITDNAWIALLGGDIDIITKFADDVLIKHGYPAHKDSYRYVSKGEAALTKLSENTFLASKVILFHAIHQMCEKFGLSFEAVRDALVIDPRIGSSHSFAPSPDDGMLGFGGHCLPKDVLAAAEIDDTGYINSILETNRYLGRP